MTTDSEVRICVNCSGEIPKWKSKGATCSAKCKFENKDKKRATKRTTGPLLHSCLSNVLDAAKSHCDCKMRLTDDQAKRMLAKGEVVNFASRLPEYIEGDALLVAGKHLMFPRSSTVEKAHIERLTNDHTSKNQDEEKSVEELEKAVAEDKAARAQEEALRLQIYGELTMKAWQQLIVEVPADEYDKAEREARGRCLFWNYEDERTCVGIDVGPRSRRDEEVDETESLSSENSDANKNESDETDLVSLDDAIDQESGNEELEEEFA